MNGTVGILNVGAGDTKLIFDKDNPIETARAARIVKDMIRRGYVLFVEIVEDGKKVFRRALDFDESTAEYIIADLDPLKAQEADNADKDADESVASAPSQTGVDGYGPVDNEKVGSGRSNDNRRRGRPLKKRVLASSTSAVSVPRTAGG
jgi:hypothetical protein